ncbi:MAG: GGDEF domain-containing protein [Candidatus Woesearchaeota archaeon]
MSENLIKNLKSENRNLKREVKKLKVISFRDSLTGLSNKTGFEHEVISAISMARRAKSCLCLGIFDLDGFKQFNDKKGHKEGDKVLIEFAKVLEKNTRLGDVLSRWGGDEFVVVLQFARLADALEVGERIRESIEKIYRGKKYSITVSGGFSEICFKDVDLKTHVSNNYFKKIYLKLFKQADKKLLDVAKVNKNKIV